MGAIQCCTEMGDTGVLRDMPAPETEGLTDQYQIWEYGLPFKRVPFLAFKRAVKAAEKDCGDKGYVTIEALKERLVVPGVESWKALEDSNSEICKLLLGSLFKDAKGLL